MTHILKKFFIHKGFGYTGRGFKEIMGVIQVCTDCGKLLISVDNRNISFGKWYGNSKTGAFSEGTFCFYIAFVGINHCFNIA
jgi:hypothetical protein